MVDETNIDSLLEVPPEPLPETAAAILAIPSEPVTQEQADTLGVELEPEPALVEVHGTRARQYIPTTGAQIRKFRLAVENGMKDAHDATEAEIEQFYYNL